MGNHKRELSDDELSMVYSLYDYCNHSLSVAQKEFTSLTSTTISPPVINREWEEEGWSVNDLLRRPRRMGGHSNEEILSVVYSLHEYCLHNVHRARKEFEEIFSTKIYPGFIAKLWYAEEWEVCIPKKNLNNKPSTTLLSKWSPKDSFASIQLRNGLTEPQKEKLDRLFSDEKGDAKAASRRMLTVSPEEAWKYWKSQGFVKGNYVPHRYNKKVKEGSEKASLEDFTGDYAPGDMSLESLADIQDI